MNNNFGRIGNTVLVGIGHKARQGKDTLANILNHLLGVVEDRGKENSSAPLLSKVYSFASALRAYARVAGLMTRKDSGLLQILGTEVFKRNDENFWARILSYQIEEEKPQVAIIQDVRFPVEFNWVNNNGGINIDVRRMNADDTQFISDDRPADHPSETALDRANFDYVVTATTGDIDKLFEEAEYLTDIILGIVRERKPKHIETTYGALAAF